jgi:hypothetical protein
VVRWLREGARGGGILQEEGKIHRVDPDFGPTLTASNRDKQSNCWVNLKILGQPCGFQVKAREAGARGAPEEKAASKAASDEPVPQRRRSART